MPGGAKNRFALLIGTLTTILVLLIVSLISTCGGSIPSEEWKPSDPINFSYQLEGKTHMLSDLRSRPLVLVLMRTSELPSQMYMGEVKKAFTKIAGTVRFLVLTVESRETPFVAPYVESEKLPFPIGIAEPDVASGLSPLGLIPTMPTTYLIDSTGCVFDGAAGIVKSDHLVQAVQQVSDH